MTFKSLKIHNIASIADAYIDFTAPPLAGSDVFLITGKTGSGKSTILDAICLALYNNTPRLENFEQRAKLEHDHDLSVKDPQNLMRRGTGECSVSLVFEGNDECDYEAVWSAARSRRKSDGNPQGKQWSLRNCQAGSILTKDAEVSSAIKTLTGLSFEQFCRTTMLAQGEFLRFLNSKDEKKADILEKITGTDIYSQIGRKIYEITSCRKEEYQSAENKVKDIVTFSDEQVAEKRASIAENEGIIGQRKKHVEVLQTCVKWLEDKERIEKQLHEATTAVEVTGRALAGEEYTKGKRLVEQWNATIEARQHLVQLNSARTEQNKLAEETSRQEIRYRKALCGLNHLAAATEEARAEVNQQHDFLKSEEPRASVLAQEQVIVSWLNDITSAYGNISAISKKVDGINKQLQQIEARKKETVTERDRLEKLVAQMNEDVAEKQGEFNATGIASLRERKDSLTATINSLDVAATLLNGYLGEADRLRSEARDIETMRANLSPLNGELDAKRELYKVAEKEATDANESYKKLSGSVEEWAKVARANLKAGDCCPVCRQVVAQAPHVEEELQALVEKAKHTAAECEKKRKELELACNKLEASIKAGHESIGNREKALESQQIALHGRDIETGKALQKALMRETPITVFEQETLTEISNMRVKCDTELCGLKAELAKAEQKECELNTALKSLSAKKEELAKAEHAVSGADADLLKCNADIETERKLSAQHAENAKKLETELAEMLAGNHWNHDWRENRQAFASELRAACKKYSEATASATELEKKLELAEQEKQSVVDDLQQIRDTMPGWANVTVDEKTAFDGLSRAVRDLLAKVTAIADRGKALAETVAQEGSWLTVFHDGSDITPERLSELVVVTQSEVHELKLRNEKLEQSHRDASKVQKLRADELSEHIKKKPDLANSPLCGIGNSAPDTVDVLRVEIEGEQREISAAEQALGATRLELENDAKNHTKKKQLEAETESKKSLYLRWAALSALLGDSAGKNFRIVAQSYILDNITHTANHYMHTLTDRYELRVMPGSLVIEVLDAWQGYTARPGSTLSGGEGFLVSLALALSLSDVSGRRSPNILFIDEGFGTLSGEPLQNAVNTLKSLHTKTGRHVGIISHIEELRERLPVQIRVEQPGLNSASEVNVIATNHIIFAPGGTAAAPLSGTGR